MALTRPRTRKTEQYRNSSISSDGANSIRARAFKELDESPLNTAKRLAVLLNLPYREYRNYLTKLRSEWKYYHKSERGSKCSSFHCVRWGLWERVVADRVDALRFGWVQSRARNRFLQFKNGLGRVVWFETGTVRLHVRSPGDEGRAKQLFCDAFFKSGLIFDVNVLNKYQDSLFLDSFHTVVKTDRRLPYVHVRDFEGTNGFEFKSGDRTHPHCFEFIVRYQSQFEEAKRAFAEITKALDGLVHPNGNGVVDDGGQKHLSEYLR